MISWTEMSKVLGQNFKSSCDVQIITFMPNLSWDILGEEARGMYFDHNLHPLEES